MQTVQAARPRSRSLQRRPQSIACASKTAERQNDTEARHDCQTPSDAIHQQKRPCSCVSIHPSELSTHHPPPPPRDTVSTLTSCSSSTPATFQPRQHAPALRGADNEVKDCAITGTCKRMSSFAALLLVPTTSSESGGLRGYTLPSSGASSTGRRWR